MTSLNGEPEPGLFIEALGQGSCSTSQEEAKTETNGQYRIRGLQVGRVHLSFLICGPWLLKMVTGIKPSQSILAQKYYINIHLGRFNWKSGTQLVSMLLFCLESNRFVWSYVLFYSRKTYIFINLYKMNTFFSRSAPTRFDWRLEIWTNILRELLQNSELLKWACCLLCFLYFYTKVAL